MRFERLAEWLAWQETQHPRAVDPGLERVAAVAERMGLDRPGVPVAIVAGTNGKGTVAACLEALLRRAGHLPGCYTSPHLLRYNERIRIAGSDASDAQIMAAFDAIDRARGSTSLSYFEFGTLAAMWCFREAGCDAWILEVGLGGRLDAVNLVDADVAVITSIDVDHTEWLGADREAIGREKAGVMRAGRPTICGDPRPPASIGAHAEAIGAEFLRLGRDFRAAETAPGRWHYRDAAGRFDELPSPPGGDVAVSNAALALAAYRRLPGVRALEGAAPGEALGGVRVPARRYACPGREHWHVDVAHNPAAAAALAKYLAVNGGAERFDAVFALLRRKDIHGVVTPLLPVIRRWHFLELPDADAWPAHELRAAVDALGGAVGATGPAEVLLDDIDAQALARARAVIAFGSFRVAEAVLRWSEVGEGAFGNDSGAAAWTPSINSV